MGAATASNRFGFDFYARATVGQRNLICSPASASILLAMTSAGARGVTQTEMLRILHVPPSTQSQMHASFGELLDTLNKRNGQEGVVLRVADRIWGQADLDFNPEFLGLLRDRYQTPLEKVDFVKDTETARASINRWVATETHNRIGEAVPGDAVDSLTLLLLVNVVYFKGEWVDEFSHNDTRNLEFAIPEGKVVTKMMQRQGTLAHGHVGDVQIVELPYKGGLSMVVMLPDAMDGLVGLEARLAHDYEDWMRALHPTQVDLQLPPWTATSRLELRPMLAAMGMPTAFSNTATFSRIASVRPLFIDQALQQAFVEVNETGAEAAAATTYGFRGVALDDSAATPVPFHADHPFAYLIRDTKTGAILFMGRVVDPRRQM